MEDYARNLAAGISQGTQPRLRAPTYVEGMLENQDPEAVEARLEGYIIAKLSTPGQAHLLPGAMRQLARLRGKSVDTIVASMLQEIDDVRVKHPDLNEKMAGATRTDPTTGEEQTPRHLDRAMRELGFQWSERNNGYTHAES